MWEKQCGWFSSSVSCPYVAFLCRIGIYTSVASLFLLQATNFRLIWMKFRRDEFMMERQCDEINMCIAYFVSLWHLNVLWWIPIKLPTWQFCPLGRMYHKVSVCNFFKVLAHYFVAFVDNTSLWARSQVLQLQYIVPFTSQNTHATKHSSPRRLSKTNKF